MAAFRGIIEVVSEDYLAARRRHGMHVEVTRPASSGTCATGSLAKERRINMKWETSSYIPETRKASVFLERPLRDGDAYDEQPKRAEEVSESVEPPSESTLDHERAQQLIIEQARTLLPPSVANALADHLLTCDRCFRFAQDVAHQERQSGKHKAAPHK